MYTIRQITNEEIQHTTYHKGHERHKAYVILDKDKPIAYVWFDKKEMSIFLHMIEVIEKRKGNGVKVIDFLFQYYSIEKIEGFVSPEMRAYLFWRKIGAIFYYIDVEGYEDADEVIEAELESPFMLTKGHFLESQKNKLKKGGI